MAARRIGDRLRHMLEAANAMERLAAGKTLEDFGADPDMAAAMERYLERLSEASRHVPQRVKSKGAGRPQQAAHSLQPIVLWWSIALSLAGYSSLPPPQA